MREDKSAHKKKLCSHVGNTFSSLDPPLSEQQRDFFFNLRKKSCKELEHIFTRYRLNLVEVANHEYIPDLTGYFKKAHRVNKQISVFIENIH